MTTSANDVVFPKLNSRQIINLGWAHPALRDGGYNDTIRSPKTSYMHFTRHKAQDKIRIGVFGCSFVEGVEAAHGFDFPSLLKEEFGKAGINNVEVINFGMAGYGVHQSYLLWEYLGQYYDLDYTIFMYFDFHKERDKNFCSYDYFGPVHSRFILKDEKLKLVTPLGNTRLDACRIYHRMLPPWQYIRYNHEAPVSLRCLIPADSKPMRNPSYYNFLKSDDEILKTYSMLFERLSEQNINPVFICDDDIIYNLKNSLSLKNTYFLKNRSFDYIQKHKEIYKAPMGHFSALGNRLRAKELFSLLTGKSGPEFDVIAISSDIAGTSAKTSSSFQLPLCEYENIAVKIGQQPVTSFHKRVKGKPWLGKLNFQEYKDKKVKSLLWINTINRQLIPLPFFLNNKEPVFLFFKSNNQLIKIPIGVVNASNPIIGTLALNKKKIKSENWNLYIDENWFKFFIIQTNGKKIKDIAIIAGDESRKICQVGKQHIVQQFKEGLKRTLDRKQRFFIQPVSEYSFLRVPKGISLDIEKIEEKIGMIDIVLTKKNGHTDRYPILSYVIKQVVPPSFEPRYPNPIGAKHVP
ncbi:MAG: hypothetical protein GY749_45175 [Desulfobacteraceae bacterium]|nr:hypothetical protein [Desulfobacteraceae bacterium]